MFVSSVPGESPPPPQRIFGRDELVKNIVDLTDTDNPTPIALTGTGGIGKSSVALAVLHDNRIKRRFGDHRRLLRCDQFSASLPNFLRRLSEVIGAGTPNPTDLTSLRPFLSRNRMFIIIDNAESILGGPTTEDIDSVVKELSQFRNICLCITSRTSLIPTRCKVITVPTLSMEATRETFRNIYRCDEQSDALDDILKQLDFHPLSITLLATAAKHNKWGIGRLEREWEEQRTGILRTRYHGSLAATIELSLHSPMFRDLGPHARDLLGVVAFFPQGVDENNLDWLFPSITDRKKVFGGFCALSLTHRNNGFVTMLAPLRDHLCPKDPLASLLCSVKEHYFSRLSFFMGTPASDNDGATWIASDDVNIEHLLDIFTSIDVNSESVWDACGHFMRHLLLHKPRLPVFGPKIVALPGDYPSKPGCLSELSVLYASIGNYAEARRLLCHALELYRGRGNDYRIASTLWVLARSNFPRDHCEEGIRQAEEAMTIFQRIGNTEWVVHCHSLLSTLFRRVNRLDDAEKCANQAIALADGLISTTDYVSLENLRVSLFTMYSHRGDTEKAIFHAEASIGETSSRSSRFLSHLNLAMIHITERRLGDAETHLEHAGSLAVNGSSEPSTVALLRARLLVVQGKLGEARSEALRGPDLLEFRGGGNVKAWNDLLRLVDKEMVEWAFLSGFFASPVRRTRFRMASLQICECNPPYLDIAADTSLAEEIHKVATRMVTLLEKDGGRPGGPNSFQIREASQELTALVVHHEHKKINEAIVESLAIPTAVDEPEGMSPPEPLMRQDNR